MTLEAQVDALHRALKTGEEYFLIKRGLYYRPNAAGYTDQVSEAGRFTRAERDLHTDNEQSREVGSQLVPRAKFSTYEEIVEAEKKLISPGKAWQWGEELHKLTGEAGMALVSTIEKHAQDRCARAVAMAVHLTPAQRLEALVRALGLWTA